MNGIHFVTEEGDRKVGALIDLKKHGAYEQYRANRLKRARPDVEATRAQTIVGSAR